MVDQAHPGGGAADRDPWAPPEHKTSLDKGHQSSPQDQPPNVHDQATVTSVPPEGFAPPGVGAPGYGYPAPGTPQTPGYGTPGYPPPGATPAPNGWAESAVPPPPMAPGGPGPQGAGMPPGGYGYPAYPQGYGWPGMQAPPQNGLGTSAMILGILSCCLFCIYGIVSLVLGVLAVVLGVKGKRKADRGEATNRGQAQAGFITGIVGIVLGIATIALIVIAIVVASHEEDTVDNGPSYNSAPSVSAPLVVEG
ncbi:DUF4190 domain-containing protein [Streptomyces sp. NPDC001617]